MQTVKQTSNGSVDAWASAVVAHYDDNDIPHIASSISSDEYDTNDDVDEKKIELSTTSSTSLSKGNTSTTTTNNLADTLQHLNLQTSPTNDTTFSSPKSTKSDFRQSLDDEARQKDEMRKLELEHIAISKQLLRESLDTITARESSTSFNNKNTRSTSSSSANNEGVLTRPERQFLESLLESNEVGVAEACVEAHRRLTDANLFFWAVCGGSAGEVDDLIPGHGWETKSSKGSSSLLVRRDEATTKEGSVDGKEDWVQEWVEEAEEEKGTKNKPPQAKEDQDFNHKSTISDMSMSSTSGMIKPYEIQRLSSEARLNRLAYRRRQSSNGGDNVRLFRAHEAGLTVTEQGSARRSLIRMGLPMEKGLFPAAMSQNKLRDSDSLASNVGGNQTSEGDDSAMMEAPFVKELAKMDEKTIRRIEKEERAKQRNRAGSELDLLAGHSVGCTSPFSMSILRMMYASKQFSFHRQSSSYSRYDSLLVNSSTEQFENDIVEDSKTDSQSEVTGSQSDVGLVVDTKQDDIFRPTARAKTSGERLKNLLISAGLSHPSESDVGLIMDALPGDEEDIMSTSTNSVAPLLKGGPSFREETVFRDSNEEKVFNKIGAKKNNISSSLISSLGSKSSIGSNQDDTDNLSKISPANSDVGELPPLSRSEHYKHKRHSTISIMKSSSSASPSRKGQYKRSVSWGHMVISNEERASLARNDSEASGLSIISFPNLRRAAPIRSDSIASNISAMSATPSLRMAAPLRSGSIGSVSSLLSSVPSISRAHPVFSPRNSFGLMSPPALSRARAVRSESQTTLGGEYDDYSAHSFGSVDLSENERAPDRAAWMAPRRWQPPRHEHSRQQSSASLSDPSEHPVLIRQASRNNYDGEGMEIDDLIQIESIEDARNFKSMVSLSDYSAVSSRSRANSISIRLPISLDDGFIIRNVDFERHSSEILRSLSNEDLYTSHNVETIGGMTKRKQSTEGASTERVHGDLAQNESWDIDSTNSFAPPQNAWSVLDDEYAEGYGAFNTLSFHILGTSANDAACHPHVLSPPLMESISNFLPPSVSENNFWLKYSLVRDGASLPSLLRHVRGAKHTVIGIETVDGEVFGCFTSTPWRRGWNYYGSGESFLWRMRRTRADKDLQHSILDQAKLESELDVFYWSGRNDLNQYSTHDMIAVGGGALSDEGLNKSATSVEERDLPPQNQAFSNADKGGFGLAIDSELLRGTSSSCATFMNPPLARAHPDGSPFEIMNLEVWALTPCNNVADAENLEMKKLFLEPYSADIGSSV
jgi:hypothetical protein